MSTDYKRSRRKIFSVLLFSNFPTIPPSTTNARCNITMDHAARMKKLNTLHRVTTECTNVEHAEAIVPSLS